MLLCMLQLQIPVCVSREEIDPDLLEREREVARGQAEENQLKQ